MASSTGPVAPKVKRTLWESILWHLQSRRSRTAIVAVVACIILNHPKLREFFGVDEKTASTFANQLIILAGILIAALTGEKFVPNGNGNGNGIKPPEEGVRLSVESVVGMKVREVLDEKLDKGLDKLVDKIKEKIKP
jgi:hypothetical protein